MRYKSKTYRALEGILLVLGIGLTVVFSTVSLRAVSAARKADAFSQSQAPEHTGSASGGSEAATKDGPIVLGGTMAGTYLANEGGPQQPGRVVGQLLMPALELTAPIISGIEDRDLVRGIGHVPGSANAGGLGNMVVAGHRDTFFRPLRRVKPGMAAVVASSNGSYRYQVDRTEIVTPEQLKVLDIGDRPGLTMITCYPFNFIGAAPMRFVVFAHLVSAAPDVK